MIPPLRSVTVTAIVVSLFSPAFVRAWCRNQPGDPGYPSPTDWSALNDTIDGRLVNVVPSAEACDVLRCTEAQWQSGIYRQTIPGSMNAVGISTWPIFPLIEFFAPVVQLGAGDTTPVMGLIPLY